jgi:4-hydroxy-tetrahydrodipicolinate synthase
MDFLPKGVIPALVTPLTKEYKVNEKILRKLIEYVIDGGVHGIFVIGTTGEFYGLTAEEKRDIIQIAIDQTKGRVPVYAGTGGITTRECITLTNIAEDCGADAVSVLTPMFIKPNQNELYLHYKEIAESTKLPIVLYNNLPKTGVTISTETAVRLADIKNIVGIKDSTGDFTQTVEYIRNSRNKNFQVLVGRDTLIHACLCYGGRGAIAACANVAPKLCAEIYDKYMAGDIAGSLESQLSLAPLRIGFDLGTFPNVIKEALQLIGIDAGPCMKPVGPMSNEEKEKLKKILKQMGLLS